MSLYRHGTAVVLGETGILLLGPSGAGKSALAERLIAAARQAGGFARLIGDDRIAITQAGGRLIVAGHPTLEGRIERRGIGIVGIAHLDRAVLGGVVQIAPQPARLPETPAPLFPLAGVDLPLLTLRGDQDLGEKAHLVLDWAQDAFSQVRKKA
jgi:HPr kinase/phosphorylase